MEVLQGNHEGRRLPPASQVALSYWEFLAEKLLLPDECATKSLQEVHLIVCDNHRSHHDFILTASKFLSMHEIEPVMSKAQRRWSASHQGIPATTKISPDSYGYSQGMYYEPEALKSSKLNMDASEPARRKAQRRWSASHQGMPSTTKISPDSYGYSQGMYSEPEASTYSVSSFNMDASQLARRKAQRRWSTSHQGMPMNTKTPESYAYSQGIHSEQEALSEPARRKAQRRWSASHQGMLMATKISPDGYGYSRSVYYEEGLKSSHSSSFSSFNMDASERSSSSSAFMDTTPRRPSRRNKHTV